jgi:hypothetical protein
MKRTLPLLLIIIALFPKSSFCQIFIEPFAGYQTDMNNTKTKLLNTGLQLAIKIRKYEFLVQLQKNWPRSFNYVDSSYTTNTSLPLNAAAMKTIRTSSFSFAIGNRIKIAGKKTKNSFFLKVYTGIMYQKMGVSYQYDKTNYILLNPDKTEEKTGFFVSGGLEYMRQFSFGRLFFDLNFSSPPTGNFKYNESYNLMAPLSLSIGYSIKLSKR